ncbi:MAG: hypothetical protein L0Y74_06350 [candidate division Zixibacteria bacterium]|nr:hypothetical protein [candidate division Zixibacteria bacterium]
MKGNPIKSFTGAQAGVELATADEKYLLYGFCYTGAGNGSVTGTNGSVYFAAPTGDMHSESFDEPIQLNGPVTLTVNTGGNLTLIGKVLKSIENKIGV